MLVDVVARYKEAVGIPCGTVTYMDPAHAPDFFEQALADGKVDFYLMNRPLTVDSEYVNKLREGRIEEIAPCTRCLHCHIGGNKDNAERGYCRVNAMTQRVFREGGPEGYELPPVDSAKKVMVIGGGPGGMEAARIAAARGHEVTLYEKGGSLGGLLDFASNVKGPHENLDVYKRQELVRTFAPKACGLANAVLRKASSLKDEFPFGNPQADLEAFARQYAFPVWLAKRLVADLGLDAASEFMDASNEPAPLFAAVNAARAADEEVRAELEAAHGDPQPVEIDGRTIPGCYRVSSGRVLQDGRIKRMLNQGKLFVSDAASQEVARLVLPATLPQSFLEIGAGRGTKTLLLQLSLIHI